MADGNGSSGRPASWHGIPRAIEHYVGQCERAGEAGIDLVCLPETILSWGAPAVEDCQVHALPVPGSWMEPFQAIARRFRMGICFSVLERAGANGEVLYNTALLLGRDGRLIGTYRKVHLALAEARQGVAAGHAYPVYDFDGVQVGMSICMDSAAAESTRLLALGGAEVLLQPIMNDFRATPWAPPRGKFDAERWKLIQRAHAIDNHLFVVVAKNVNMGSAITAPWGEILAYNEGDQDVIWADVDVDARREHPLGASMQAVMWSMRRPATYAALGDATVPAGPRSLRGRR